MRHCTVHVSYFFAGANLIPPFVVGPEPNRALLGLGSTTDRPNHLTYPKRLLSNGVRAPPRGIGAIATSEADDGDDEATSRTSRMKPSPLL